MNDLVISVGARLLTCDSRALQHYSPIFRCMFEASLADGWSNGVSAALDGHPPEDVELFLAIVHSKTLDVAAGRSTACRDWNDLLGVFKIADMLDAMPITRACEAYMMLHRAEVDGGCLHTLAIASAVGLTELRSICLKDIIHKILSQPTLQHLADVPGLEVGWDELSAADMRVLLQATVRARHEIARALDDVVVSYVRDDYCKAKALERRRMATSTDAVKLHHYLRQC